MLLACWQTDGGAAFGSPFPEDAGSRSQKYAVVEVTFDAQGTQALQPTEGLHGHLQGALGPRGVSVTWHLGTTVSDSLLGWLGFFFICILA